MVPSGPPTPIGGTQSISPSLLRSNSALVLGTQGQGGAVPSQSSPFPSLVSPRTPYNNINLLGNVPNVSSLFGNGGSNSGLSGAGSIQRGGALDNGVDSDPLSAAGNGMRGYNLQSMSSFPSSNMPTPSTSAQAQGQQFSNPSGGSLAQDQQQPPQLEPQNFQQAHQVQQNMHQFPVPNSQQQQLQQQQQQQQHQQQQQQHQQHLQQQHQQQQHYQSIRGGLGTGASVKLEPQMSNDQNGHQQLQSLRNLGQVKLEPQQIQTLRSLAPVKMEPQHSEQSLFLQQQHQQQFLNMSRQSSQAAAAQINILQQQRLLQLQQQQQQQQQHLLKSLPQQRSQLQQQFQQQNLPVRAAVKPAYEPGTCARRLTHYMYHQQHRPADNNIEFWRKFVAEYFAPHAKKRWCVSLYANSRQTPGVFPQDVWHCEICNRKPGRGFETTVEVLPRLCKIKYDSGTLEELLYVDMPREYQNAAGQIVLDYSKAIQESVFEHLRVVRDGQLRIVFSSDLKICSWEFCARHHEELIPRRLIIPQVGQLGAAAQKYQAASQNGSSNLSAQELQNNCNMFVASARQLAKSLEVPLVNDLGYTKRYVRCLQISEVVNSMKDLIDYSRETGNGPMASLINFPRRNNTSSGICGQGQQLEEQQQQPMGQNTNNDRSSIQANAMQIASSNGSASVSNSINPMSACTSTSASTIVGLLHQNPNSRQENLMNHSNGPYSGGNAVQIPPASSSSSLSQPQPNPTSPFPSTSSPANNIPQQTSHSSLPPAAAPAASGTGSVAHITSTNSPAGSISMQQQAGQSTENEANDSQSSVQQIIQEIMMSSQLNGGNSMVGVGSSLGNEMKNINGLSTNSAPINGGNCLIGNGNGNGIMTNNSSGTCVGFGSMGGGGGGGGMPNAASGIRAAAAAVAAMGNNNNSLNMMNGGRVGMGSLINQDHRNNMNHHQQQDLGNRLLSGLGPINNFNNLDFDWKPSP